MTTESNYLMPIFDVIPLPCIIVQLDAPHFTIKNTNKAYQVIANISKTKLIGEKLETAFTNTNFLQSDSSVINEIITSLNTVVATKQIHKLNNVKFNLTTNITTTKYWHLEHTPLLDNSNNIIYILQSFTAATTEPFLTQPNFTTNIQSDNSEITLQVDEMKRIKNNHAAIINSTDDLIFSIDKNLRLITFNTSYQQLIYGITGRLEKEGDEVLTGRLGKELTEKWKGYFEKAFKGEKFSTQEVIYNPLKGYKQYGLVNINPVFNGNGEIESVACFAKDVTASTESHLQLQKTKNELDKILAASLDIICVTNKDNIFIKVSAASEKVWGYKPEELIGHSIFEFIHPDYAALTEQATLDIMKRRNVFNFENRYIKKDGSVVAIEWTARWDEKEQMRYGIARDVTDKKKNEFALIDSEAKYKALFENNPLPMFIWDFETLQIVNCNTEALLLYGYTKDEFLNLSIKDIRPAEDISLLLEATKKEEIYGQIHKQAWRHKKKNGELINVDIHAHILNYQGKISSLVLVNDITKKLAVELEIERSNERYEYVIKATSDAIWDWDLENNRLLWGDGFNTLFGYHLCDLENENISFHFNLIHPDDRERINDSYKQIVKSTTNKWEESYRFKKADGTYAYVIDKGFAIRNTQGKTTRLVGAKRDITLNRYYNELEKLERNILAYRQMGKKNVVDTLTTYILGIEELHPGMMCTVCEKKGNQLFTIAAPTIPNAYNQLINGITIDNNVGSCSTACYLNEKVIVSDIENDIRWSNFKHLISEFNLASCWSYPIINLKGEVVGTFAIYSKEKKMPSEVEENTINRVVNIIQIIIESANRTRAIEDSNLRYNYVTKATSDAIYDWNLEDNSVFWGDVFFKIFGWDLQKMNAKKNFCFDRIHPNDKNKLLNNLFSAINGTAISWEGEYRFLKANDSYTYVIDRAYIIRDTNGKAIRVIGSKIDITERKKELIHLKLLESVITNTNDVVVITEAEALDTSGPKIVYVNEAFTKLTGYQPEEIIGKTPRILQGPKTDEQELEKLKDYMAALKPCEITLVNYKKNNEEYWVNINLNPVMDENGKISHWVSLQRDITDKKQQEINMMKAIIKTQEDERYEVGGELHDNVCQILTSSQIALKMIKKSLPETEIERFNQGINYISLATNEIRNLSHRLAPAFFNDTTLADAFEDLVKNFNIENTYKILLNFDAEFKNTPTKREFQLNLYRILQEQLKNILKYAAATSIHINGYVKDTYFILSVYDNGIGFNINSSKKGIGIANMKRRVELFSGKFSIQSLAGKGCTILIEIPMSEIN